MSLKKIEDKVLSGERLTSQDALTLFLSDDIFTIGRLASEIAYRKNGNNVYFIQNHHINPTNICINRCKFCAFSRSKGEEGAYELSIQEIIKKLRAHESTARSQQSEDKKLRSWEGKKISTSQPLNFSSSQSQDASRITHHGLSEVHIVGGLHPEWSFDFYLEMLRTLKDSFPHIHIKAFTPVEIDYFSRISGLSLQDTLIALKSAGLDSIPGGGAEIFDEEVRGKLCPEKIDGRRWLEIMETAHALGIRSNATMLYGHIEKYEHRIEHMLRLRDLQDRTGGFQAFIPLAFHPKNTGLSEAVHMGGIDDLKTVAISRLLLDNFEHIKAYWVMLGAKIAQLALLFGADDLDGTVGEEKITHSAGGLSDRAISKKELINLIRKAGKTPVERDSFYNPVKSEE